MYHWLTLLSIVTLCCCQSETKPQKKITALKVTAHTQSDVDAMMNISRYWNSLTLNVTVGGSIVFQHLMLEEQELRSHGLDIEIIDDPLQSKMTHQKRYEIAQGSEVFAAGSRFSDLVLDKFHSTEEIIEIVRAAHDTYPDITEVVKMGESIMGTPILALKIGTKKNNKRGIYIDAGYRGSGWITTAASLYLVHHLLSNYTSNNVVTKLVNKFDWYIAPLINPDGLSYSMERDRFWRGNRYNYENDTSCNPSGNTYRDGYNQSALFKGPPDGCCQGAMLNWNFDFKWPKHYGGHDDYIRCVWLYSGTKAFSEKESIAVRDFILSRPRTLMFATISCCQDEVIVPYHDKGNERLIPDNLDEMLRIAELGATAMGTVVRKATSSGMPAAWARAKAGVPYTYLISLGIDLDSKTNMGQLFNLISSSSKIVPYGEGLIKLFSAMGNALISRY